MIKFAYFAPVDTKMYKCMKNPVVKGLLYASKYETACSCSI